MPHYDFPQSFCHAALGRADITPPAGIYHRMWGAAQHDQSTGIHRPLTVTALVLGPTAADGAAPDRGGLQALVGIDHCLMWNDEMDALRQSVCKATGLASHQLHISFSHTHAAGLMDPARANLPGGHLIAPYLNVLAERTAEAVRQAIDSLQPAGIVYGQGRCRLAANRDLWDETSGQFVCGFNPAGATDDTLIVARAVDRNGETLGTVVNYACHPTTLAWDNTLISPDFVGAMREVVETATAAPCLFLQGASGDLGPREGFVGDVNVADSNGRQLGYAALATLESLPRGGTRYEYAGPVVSGATIGVWAHRALEPEALCRKYRWQCEQIEIELSYRADLPTREQTETELARWQADEQAALDRGDAEAVRDCRAQAERMTRQLARLKTLPPGRTVPLEGSLWRLGDAVWITLQGEHYHVLQKTLRQRFAKHPLIVVTVTNGWRPGYIPSRETYGRGIYQESIAVVAAGSLEQVIERLADRVAALLVE